MNFKVFERRKIDELNDAQCIKELRMLMIEDIPPIQSCWRLNCMWEKDHSPKPNKDYIMPATLPGPEAMEVNPITLSFSGDLGKAFLEDYYKNSLSLVRSSLF